MVFGLQELLYFMQKLLPSSIKDDDIASKTQKFLYSLLMKAALALEMLFLKCRSSNDTTLLEDFMEKSAFSVASSHPLVYKHWPSKCYEEEDKVQPFKCPTFNHFLFINYHISWPLLMAVVRHNFYV